MSDDVSNVSTASSVLIEIMVVGGIATLVWDLWQRLAHAIARLPPANWGLVGRWVAWFPRGVFVHRPITATAPVPGEAAIGWAFHYAVGIAYAALYFEIMWLGLRSGPTLVSALGFAIALLAAPGSSCNRRSASASWPRARHVQPLSVPSMCRCTRHSESASISALSHGRQPWRSARRSPAI